MLQFITETFSEMVTWLTFVLGSLSVYAVHSASKDDSGPIKIASFNVQVFGVHKSSNDDVIDTLVKIVLRYDIIFIQEIRDSSDKSMNTLMLEVNKASNKKFGVPYKSVVSPRLGRTNSKEQYAFIYRPDRLDIVEEYVFKDGEGKKDDLFQREPYVVKVKSPNSEVKTFALIGIHVQPEDAVNEIISLEKVYDSMKRKWKLEDAIIMGDFNAGCSYVPKKAWPTIPIYTKTEKFTWLIGNQVDTTSGPSDCAYDRFIVAGKKMTDAIIPDSAKVFRFDTAFKLSQKKALEVSDHYPIELELEDKTTKRPHKKKKNSD